jgi:hypothetical protein
MDCYICDVRFIYDKPHPAVSCYLAVFFRDEIPRADIGVDFVIE